MTTASVVEDSTTPQGSGQTPDSFAWELRVLAGPQAGSRLVLAVAEEYTLGMGDQCAIILIGPYIENEHALLVLDGSGASIRPLQGELRNSRGEVVEDELVLVPGMRLDLGGVWIALDRPDAPWPDMALNEARQPEASELAEPDQAAGELLQPEMPVAGAVDGAARAGQGRKIPLAWYGILLVLLLASLSLILLGSDQDASVPAPQEAAPVPAARAGKVPSAITDFLHRFNPDQHFEVGRDENGDWLVQGYVETSAQKKALAEGLADIGPPVLVKVKVMDDLVAAARQMLAQRAANLPLQVASGEGGVLILRGAAPDEGTLQGLVQDLRTNLPDLKEVRTEVLLPAQLRERFKQRMDEAGLGKQLKVMREEPEMVLDGKLSEEQISAWEKLLVGFSREYGNVLPIRANVSRLVQKLPIGIQAVVSGPTPYVITDQGQRINLGGSVNGVKLTAIRDGEVIFEGKQRYKLAR